MTTDNEGNVRLWILDQTEFMDGPQREAWLTNEIVRLRRTVDRLADRAVDVISTARPKCGAECVQGHTNLLGCSFYILAE